MAEDRLDTMLSGVGESYEDFVEKFVETYELREYSALFDALSKTCQKLDGILPGDLELWWITPN